MRTRKLIRPGMQLRLTLWFVGLAVLSLCLQFVLFTRAVSAAALDLPGDVAQNFDRLSDAYVEVLVWSLAIVIPLTALTGVVATFRVAGPIYRIQAFLEAVRRGERPADCHVRKGDELHDICDLVNEVTAELRAQDAEAPREAA